MRALEDFFFLVRSLGTVFGVVETSREVVLLLTSALGPSRTFQWLHRIDFFFFVSCSRLFIASVGGRQRFISFSWKLFETLLRNTWKSSYKTSVVIWVLWFIYEAFSLNIFGFERKDSMKSYKHKLILKLFLESLQNPLDKTLKSTR